MAQREMWLRGLVPILILEAVARNHGSFLPEEKEPQLIHKPGITFMISRTRAIGCTEACKKHLNTTCDMGGFDYLNGTQFQTLFKQTLGDYIEFPSRMEIALRYRTTMPYLDMDTMKMWGHRNGPEKSKCEAEVQVESIRRLCRCQVGGVFHHYYANGNDSCTDLCYSKNGTCNHGDFEWLISGIHIRKLAKMAVFNTKDILDFDSNAEREGDDAPLLYRKMGAKPQAWGWKISVQYLPECEHSAKDDKGPKFRLCPCVTPSH